MKRAGRLLFAAGMIAACGETIPRTQVMLVVDAEPGVRGQTDHLRVVVRGGDGASTTWQERLDLELTPGDGWDWPAEVAIVPTGGDAERVYSVEASAVDSSDEAVAVVRAVSGFRSGRTLLLRLVLEDACRSQVTTCTATETCRAGTCVPADVDVTTLTPYKPTASRDASVEDGGGSDATSVLDAGRSDGGGTDSRVEAGEIQCETNADCNAFEDGNLCNGTLVCTAEHQCNVDPATVPAPCDTSQDSECGVTRCQPDTGQCALVVNAGVSTCDDRNACTQSDQCVGGTCQGAAISCDDEKVCTSDSCDPSVGCVYISLAGMSCNDGSVFTDGDTCTDEDACVGDAIQCRTCSSGRPCPTGYDCWGGHCFRRTTTDGPCPPGTTPINTQPVCGFTGIHCQSGGLCEC